MRHFLQIFSLQLKSGPDPSFCHEDHSRSTKELDDAVVGTYARKNGIPEIKKIYITLSSRRTKRCQVLLFFYEALLSQKRSCLGSIGILDRIKHEDGRYIFLWPVTMVTTCQLCGVNVHFQYQANQAICNGNRTEWSPIRSVIIRVINKTRSSDLFNHEYDYRPNWTTRSSVTN